ncbi:hypothetical protein [Pseudonocardia nigra]|uniref:hypothetical protein n=1 Tax=Pseudonocardia nigra TaxID=1921578 RepID=UPI001C5D562F|nr:hypothetical protein [Pseudonocardia nigra]
MATSASGRPMSSDGPSLRSSVGVFVIVIALISFTCSYLMAETLRTGLRADEPVRVR